MLWSNTLHSGGIRDAEIQTARIRGAFISETKHTRLTSHFYRKKVSSLQSAVEIFVAAIGFSARQGSELSSP